MTDLTFIRDIHPLALTIVCLYCWGMLVGSLTTANHEDLKTHEKIAWTLILYPLFALLTPFLALMELHKVGNAAIKRMLSKREFKEMEMRQRRSL